DALCAAGYDVLEAGNGKEAIGLLERESVDLALVDIRMPQMSGIDLLQTLREARRRLPVIMMTGEPTLDTSVGALREGALDYLSKPFTVTSLMQAITQGLTRTRVSEAEDGWLEVAQSALASHEKRVGELTVQLQRLRRKLMAEQWGTQAVRRALQWDGQRGGPRETADFLVAELADMMGARSCALYQCDGDGLARLAAHPAARSGDLLDQVPEAEVQGCLASAEPRRVAAHRAFSPRSQIWALPLVLGRTRVGVVLLVLEDEPAWLEDHQIVTRKAASILARSTLATLS
ncbi:MAG TPA: response regulator, partial [Armatimonadota bacterium]